MCPKMPKMHLFMPKMASNSLFFTIFGHFHTYFHTIWCYFGGQDPLLWVTSNAYPLLVTKARRALLLVDITSYLGAQPPN